MVSQGIASASGSRLKPGKLGGEQLDLVKTATSIASIARLLKPCCNCLNILSYSRTI